MPQGATAASRRCWRGRRTGGKLTTAKGSGTGGQLTVKGDKRLPFVHQYLLSIKF